MGIKKKTTTKKSKKVKPKSKYKSKFEEQFAKLFDGLGVKFDYELEPIPYLLECKYFPDFFLGSNILIETKGRFVQADRRKHLALKKQHPHLDIRFIFYRDERISKKSKTKYSDWCEKYGYRYSVGLGIPEQWLKDIHESRKEDLDDQNTQTPTSQKHQKVYRKQRTVQTVGELD